MTKYKDTGRVANEPVVVLGALGDDPPKATLYYGQNVLEGLRRLPANSVNMVCTSPPYWSLRDYGVEPQTWGGDQNCDHDWGVGVFLKKKTGGVNPNTSTLGRGWGNGLTDEQVVKSNVRSHVGPRSSSFCLKCNAWHGCLGLEPNPTLFVEHLVEIGREIRRVLHPSGTFWLNLGSSYMSHAASVGALVGGREGSRQRNDAGYKDATIIGKPRGAGLKDKDLVGIPWMSALALQADGWWLRNDIIWQKCLGESTRLYARTQKGEMPAMIKDLVRLDPSTVDLWDGSKWTQVVRWEKVESDGLEIEFQSGERITCTGEHRWPTARGLLEAKHMVAGDVVSSIILPDVESISGADGRAKIVTIREVKDHVFYDIEVEDEPHLFATASGLMTHNSNAMPSSVRDRFSCKYEHVFLFAKQSHYFFDLDAVRVPHTYGQHDADGNFKPAQQWFESGEGNRKMDQTEGQLGTLAGSPIRFGRGVSNQDGKNPGDIWRMATAQYKGAHFAVWPPLLVQRMIRAGSSEKGRCPSCKSPWVRVTGLSCDEGGDMGWEQGCDCPEHKPERCVILDTFSGSGTTGLVAMENGRDYIGLDLNAGYLPLAEARLTGRKAPIKDDEPNPIDDLFGDGT